MTSVQEQLRTFATTLLERRGALVEWPAADRAGTAVLPPEAAAAAGMAADVVPLAPERDGRRALRQFGGRFPGMVRPVARRPAQGRRLPHPRRVPQAQGPGRNHSPGIHMAQRQGETPGSPRNGRRISHLVVPHFHQFRGPLGDVFCISLNVGVRGRGQDSRSVGPVGDPTAARRRHRGATSYPLAVAAARRRFLQLSAAFLDRMDAGSVRDRKRLDDYYHALLRESEKKKARANVPPDPEKIEATQRAVNLELRRKLAELDQRYAMESVVRPVVLIRTEVAVIAADLSVFRKQAQRWHTIYWNPLLKQFDPIRCGRCGAGPSPWPLRTRRSNRGARHVLTDNRP